MDKIKKQIPWFFPIITALIVLSILFGFGMREQRLLIKDEVEETISQRTLLTKIVSQQMESKLLKTKGSVERVAALISQTIVTASAFAINEFDLLTQTWPDGTIRSNKDLYMPGKEAGIVLPKEYLFSESTRHEILGAKKVIDAYGWGVSDSYVDTWYMPKDGGIVIYWPKESAFIYQAKANFSYADTEWLIEPPKQNIDNRTSYWTSLSLDPIPNVWMLSAVSPVYVNGTWVGSAGHDIPLQNILTETQLLQQQKGSAFVLVASKEKILASDIFATSLKESTGDLLLQNLPDRKWASAFSKAYGDRILQKKQAQYIIDEYFLTVSYIKEQDWFLITSIPLTPIQQAVKNSFKHLSNITIGSIVLEIIILSVLLAWGHRKNIEYIQSLCVLNEELHIEKVRYKNLVDKIPSVVYRCKNDLNWTMEYISEECVTVTGYESVAITNNKEICFSDLIHPDDREMVWQRVQAAIKTKELYEVFMRVQHKDGSQKWILERGQGVYNGHDLLALEGVITDITELKRVEEKLQILNNELDDKVKKRTTELELSNCELKVQKHELVQSLTVLKDTQEQLHEEQKISSLSKLVVGMAHELNTPLGNIILMVSVLEHEANEISTLLTQKKLTHKTLKKSLASTFDAISSVSNNSQRMVVLSQKFKDVSSTDYKRELTRLSLGSHILDSAIAYQEEFDKHNITLSVNCSKDIEIYASKEALTMVIKHLISNSLEHGFSDKNTGSIDINISQDERYIYICYLDNGSGIDETILENIFDPFTTSARGMGFTGLGMSIVYTLVAHGLKGNITCNKVEFGVEFKLTLPINLS